MIPICKAPGCTSRVLSKSTKSSFVSPGATHLRQSTWHRASSIGPGNSSRLLIECKKRKGKATKRSGNFENEAIGSMKEYLELGMLLGDSTNETISRVEERFVGLDMNVEAEEIKEMLQERERKSKKMEDLMNKVMGGGLEFEDSELGGEAPMWAANEKFDNAWDKLDLDISSEEGFSGIMSAEVDYLDNEEDLPEDFSYEDFENMIAKIPDNLMDGTFKPPSQSQPAGGSSKESRPPKMSAPPPRLASKPQSPQARNFEEFQDMLRDQTEHPDDYMNLSNFEVVSTAPPKPKPAAKPIPSLHKPALRRSEEEEEEKKDAEPEVSGDVVADFVVPEFKKPKVSKREKKKAKELGTKENQRIKGKKKDLKVPDIQAPVRRVESEAVAEGDGAATKKSKRKKRKPRRLADKPSNEPAPPQQIEQAASSSVQDSNKVSMQESSPPPMSDLKTTGAVFDEETQEEVIEVDQPPAIPELHKPETVAKVQESSPTEQPQAKSQKRSKKEKATKSVKDVDRGVKDSENSVGGELDTEEEENIDDRVLQELSFDESEPSEPLPATVGKPAMPTIKELDHLTFNAQLGRVNSLVISGEPVKAKVLRCISSGVFVSGNGVWGFLPFALMATARMRYLTIITAKIKGRKKFKLAKGVTGIRAIRKLALEEMIGQNIMVQVHEVNTKREEVTFAEMGSTLSTCPLKAGQILKKTRGAIMPAKVQAITGDNIFVEFRLKEFNYPIAGILDKAQKFIPNEKSTKQLKFGDVINVKVVSVTEKQHVRLMRSGNVDESRKPGRVEKKYIPGNIAEVEEFCNLLEQKKVIIKAEPGLRWKVPSTTSSFQVLMGKKVDESTESVEMTMLGRIDDEAQEIKVSTSLDKEIVRGVVASVMMNM